jgi:AcrR family transcriptional regulator
MPKASMPKPVADRRTVILDQAERLFADHGYHGAALAEIARAAKLGNAGLIHHFPSKARLYRAVLERVAAELDARLAEALAGADGPPARLRAFVRVQVDWARERPLAFRLIQRELVDNRERIASAHALPLQRFVGTGRAIIVEGQAAGVVAPGPAEVWLNLAIGALAYGALVHPTFRLMLRGPALRTERAWLDAIADHVLALLGGTLTRPAAPHPRRRARAASAAYRPTARA